MAVISRGFEDDALEGISAVAGDHVPLLGGTTGGPKFEVLGGQEVFAQGISLAVIYTKLPLCWVFEGGFEVPDREEEGWLPKWTALPFCKSTGARPWTFMMNGWGVKFRNSNKKAQTFRKIKNLMILNPLYRRYTSPDGHNYFLFSHLWPRNQTPQDKSLVTSSKVSLGDEIHLSHGTWERLLNHVGNLPMRARLQCGVAPRLDALARHRLCLCRGHPRHPGVGE